jgi:ligand-binding sensor domain-containing protein
MKSFKFQYFLFLIALALMIIPGSCKEKNEEYPVHKWSEYFYKTSSIAPRDISSILYENDHSIWLGAKGKEGLLFQDGYQWNVFDKATTGIDFDSITSIIRDGNGILWVGWRSGLATYNGSLWQKISNFDGLCVTSVVVEGIGNIRVGIKGESGGMAYLQNNEWTFFTPVNSEIPSGNINSIASDPNQELWMASADKGIIRLKNNAFTIMSDGMPLISTDFTCIASAPDGSIWSGSDASELVHFYEDTFTVFHTGTSKPIGSIAASRNGTIWCGTSGAGLIKFDGTTWTSFTVENEALPSNTILCVADAGNGILFFSVPGGQVLMIKQ